jgi:thiol-disulfide isomerase/thioredoxin
MKKAIFPVILFLNCFISYSQATYHGTPDPKHPEKKMLVGMITKKEISSDTAFSWYATSYQFYTPDSATINTFKRNPGLHFILFGGTWCEDTQTILPKFFKLQEYAGIPETNITIFSVDRDKKTYGHIAEAMGVVNVPTIIIMKAGKEIGRVVEYGTTGSWDKELAAMLH